MIKIIMVCIVPEAGLGGSDLLRRYIYCVHFVISMAGSASETEPGSEKDVGFLRDGCYLLTVSGTFLKREQRMMRCEKGRSGEKY